MLARRIGRNELAVIGICRTYVAAQRRYAKQGHDGKPAGLFATTLPQRSGQAERTVLAGRAWSATESRLATWWRRRRRKAGRSGRIATQPSPFHGYYFRILTAQGTAAPGGAKSYIVNGEMSAGFALVAWPAQYDASGVMTFAVNQDGMVHEKDLGAKTDATAAAITTYNPDAPGAGSSSAPLEPLQGVSVSLRA